MILFLLAWHFAPIYFVCADRDLHGKFPPLLPNHKKEEKGGEEQSNSNLVKEYSNKITVQNDGRRRSLSLFTWVPYGEDITVGNDLYPREISISGQGGRIAISDQSDTGVVKVFDYSNSTASAWTQVGNDLVGQGPFDLSGVGLSLSSNGKKLAIGSPLNNNPYGDEAGNVRVFKKESNTNNWVQMGLDIYGESSYDSCGRSVSISDDGTTLAIGAPRNDGGSELGDTGQVKIFKFTNGSWIQTGSAIDGVALADQDGKSISLSGDGKTVAIGSEYGGGSNDHVRIFRQMANSKWKQIGKSITGNIWNGHSVSLSNDGNTVAVGTPDSIGYVRVFRYVKGNWKKLGKSFKGKLYEGFGWTVALSDYGNVLALGSPFHTTGYIRAYHFVFGEWTQIGEDIFGYEEYSSLGKHLSLSGDGRILATNDQNLVRVLKLDSNISFGCKDSPLTFKATDHNAQNMRKTCAWVWEASAMSRCSITGVSETCPATCNMCSSCNDSPLKVKFRSGKKGKPKWRYCTWVAKKKAQRCPIKGIADTCKLTCGTCSL